MKVVGNCWVIWLVGRAQSGGNNSAGPHIKENKDITIGYFCQGILMLTNLVMDFNYFYLESLIESILMLTNLALDFNYFCLESFFDEIWAIWLLNCPIIIGILFFQKTQFPLSILPI